MDESGFSIGKINATCVIINKNLSIKYQAQPGRQEWVSVVECICADGTSIPPLVIFLTRKPLVYLDTSCYSIDAEFLLLEFLLQFTGMDL